MSCNLNILPKKSFDESDIQYTLNSETSLFPIKRLFTDSPTETTRTVDNTNAKIQGEFAETTNVTRAVLLNNNSVTVELRVSLTTDFSLSPVRILTDLDGIKSVDIFPADIGNFFEFTFIDTDLFHETGVILIGEAFDRSGVFTSTPGFSMGEQDLSQKEFNIFGFSFKQVRGEKAVINGSISLIRNENGDKQALENLTNDLKTVNTAFFDFDITDNLGYLDNRMKLYGTQNAVPTYTPDGSSTNNWQTSIALTQEL